MNHIEYVKKTVLGYFEKLGERYYIIEKGDSMVTGFWVTKLGKVHTLTIDTRSVDKLVWLS